jgi:TRAP-type C4-dicarboxylate transport system permease small subunit
MFAKIKKVFDGFLEILLTVVMTILVLDVVWQVFTRYILKDPSSWTEELATFLMIWVGMLGASVALYRGAHLGIDYFVGKFSARKKLYTEIFVFVCIGLFSLLVMLIGGVGLVNRTFALGQVSPAMKIRMGYVYLALPVSGFFLVMYSIELLIERVVALVKHKDIQTPHDIDAAAAAD